MRYDSASHVLEPPAARHEPVHWQMPSRRSRIPAYRDTPPVSAPVPRDRVANPQRLPGTAETAGPARGTVMECDECGYVFVLSSKRVVCRRCRSPAVTKWNGGRA